MIRGGLALEQVQVISRHGDRHVEDGEDGLREERAVDVVVMQARSRMVGGMKYQLFGVAASGVMGVLSM